MLDASAAFADSLLSAPVGVAVLAAIEGAARDDVASLDCPADSVPAAVARAAAAVEAMAEGEFLATVLHGASRFAGPWTPGAAATLASAYEFSARRRPIADAIANRFGGLLHAPLAFDGQEWWHSNRTFDAPYDRKFVDFTRVYGNGEFPWDGLWTASPAPPEIHDALVDTWELFPGPISRWMLPARDDVRVWRIDAAENWVDLVARYPRVASTPHSGWELPGPNQHVGEITSLLRAPGQTAVRTVVSRHVLPDWEQVRLDFDAVHLSWAGFITTEGRVSELPDGSVTMLRYWASERTLWLADVFGEPTRLPTPLLSGRVNGDSGISAVDDTHRQQRDRQVLTRLLGR